MLQIYMWGRLNETAASLHSHIQSQQRAGKAQQTHRVRQQRERETEHRDQREREQSAA